MRALVVDDSRAMRAVIRDVLNQAKFQVLEAGGVREALAALEELGAVDLALVDWNLPKSGGLQFVKAVRAKTEHDSMRLIMVMRRMDLGQVIQGVRAGVDECLVKPVTRPLLLEKLARLQFIRSAEDVSGA
jgi:two-component system, chemotaxis family, chemotaxis protein CheY